MSPLERLKSGLGLTRGDLTVALFLSATALAGLFYTHFFEEPDEFQRRVGMGRMLAVADSISRKGSLLGLSLLVDSALPEWDPLKREEVIGEGTDGEGRVELSLEDVAPIDLNSAPIEILQLLPGVGEKTAEKIVQERPFASVDDLTRVHGIGPKKLDKMRPYIVAGGGRTEPVPETLPQSGGTGGAATSPAPPSVPVKVPPERPGRADSGARSSTAVDSGMRRESEVSKE
jgi:hypothetical protein